MYRVLQHGIDCHIRNTSIVYYLDSIRENKVESEMITEKKGYQGLILFNKSISYKFDKN